MSSSETDLLLGALGLHLIVLHRSLHCGHQDKALGWFAPNLRIYWWLNASFLYIQISCSTLYSLVHTQSLFAAVNPPQFFILFKDMTIFFSCFIMILCLKLFIDICLGRLHLFNMFCWFHALSISMKRHQQKLKFIMLAFSPIISVICYCSVIATSKYFNIYFHKQMLVVFN